MSLEYQIGATYDIAVPEADTLIDAGYEVIRIYWSDSEDGTFTLEGTTITLVAGTYSYSYNKTTALVTDWVQHAYYGSTPGESPRSEPMPVGLPQSTRALIRQGVGKRLRLMHGPFSITSVTDGDTIVISSLIDVDAEALTYANWFVRSGTQSRQVRKGSNGYTPASGTLNFRRAFSPILEAADTAELWKARAMEDPSTIIDEAMNDARKELWWEEDYFIAAAANTTEYALPRTIVNRNMVKRVEYAAGDWPDDPQWVRSPSASVRMDGGLPTLSLGPGNDLSAGTIYRVSVNRFADRMDSEDDYWDAPLEWCIAETAREALRVLTVTTGKVEDIRDWRIQQADLLMKCEEYRSIYRPDVEIVVEPPV